MLHYAISNIVTSDVFLLLLLMSSGLKSGNEPVYVYNPVMNRGVVDCLPGLKSGVVTAAICKRVELLNC
jgi:hypothetical protein